MTSRSRAPVAEGQGSDTLQTVCHARRAIEETESGDSEPVVVSEVAAIGPGNAVDHRDFFIEGHGGDEQARTLSRRKENVSPGITLGKNRNREDGKGRKAA